MGLHKPRLGQHGLFSLKFFGKIPSSFNVDSPFFYINEMEGQRCSQIKIFIVIPVSAVRPSSVSDNLSGGWN